MEDQAEPAEDVAKPLRIELAPEFHDAGRHDEQTAADVIQFTCEADEFRVRPVAALLEPVCVNELRPVVAGFLADGPEKCFLVTHDRPLVGPANYTRTSRGIRINVHSGSGLPFVSGPSQMTATPTT